MTLPPDYARRVVIRGAAFVAACGVTGLLLALQVGLLRGTVAAGLTLAALFSPFALVDALLVPTPRSGPARLGRIGLALLMLFGLSAAWQWRAFVAVPPDMQTQIVTEVALRNLAFLGAYLLLETLIGSLIGRKVPT